MEEIHARRPPGDHLLAHRAEDTQVSPVGSEHCRLRHACGNEVAIKEERSSTQLCPAPVHRTRAFVGGHHWPGFVPRAGHRDKRYSPAGSHSLAEKADMLVLGFY